MHGLPEVDEEGFTVELNGVRIVHECLLSFDEVGRPALGTLQPAELGEERVDFFGCRGHTKFPLRDVWLLNKQLLEGVRGLSVRGAWWGWGALNADVATMGRREELLT